MCTLTPRKSANLRAKARLLGILKSTREHAKALGTFVFFYKSMLYLIKQGRKLRTGHPQMSTVNQIHHHAHAMDAFWAGLVAGYIVFGRNSPSAAGSSIAQQMALYVVSRIILGGAKYITKNYIANSKTELVHMSNTSWTVLASLSWAIVMYLFRADPSVLQSSMLHSMKYLYIESETWSGLSDFLL